MEGHSIILLSQLPYLLRRYSITTFIGFTRIGIKTKIEKCRVPNTSTVMLINCYNITIIQVYTALYFDLCASLVVTVHRRIFFVIYYLTIYFFYSSRTLQPTYLRNTQE